MFSKEWPLSEIFKLTANLCKHHTTTTVKSQSNE